MTFACEESTETSGVIHSSWGIGVEAPTDRDDSLVVWLRLTHKIFKKVSLKTLDVSCAG